MAKNNMSVLALFFIIAIALVGMLQDREVTGNVIEYPLPTDAMKYPTRYLSGQGCVMVEPDSSLDRRACIDVFDQCTEANKYTSDHCIQECTRYVRNKCRFAGGLLPERTEKTEWGQ